MPYPSKRDPAMEEEVLERLSKGEPLAVICRSDDKFPSPMSWGTWMRDDKELSIAYARAREVGFDAIATEGLEIVDNVAEDPASRRVRADYRLKLLAKWDPKRYGDKLLMGSDPENPLPSGFDVKFHAATPRD